MNSICFLYKSEKQIDEISVANSLDKEKDYLIRIHTCVHNIDTVKVFINTLLKRFPNAKIIGCSTSAVIFEGKLRTDCCLVSITEFKATTVRTKMVDLTENGTLIDGFTLADKFGSCINGNTKLILNFFSNLYTMSNEYVERMNVIAPNVHLIGGFAYWGQASENRTNKKYRFVFTEQGVADNASVIALFDSNEMSIYSDIICASEPVGDVHTITETDNLIIRKIEGINAVDWYEKMLGIKLSGKSLTELEELTATFPMVLESTPITRGIMYSPQDETLSFFEDEPNPIIFSYDKMKVGDKFRLSYSSINKTMDVCESVCKRFSEHPSEVFFGYACTSRQNLFQNCSEWELSPFAKTNLCGCLLEGEIGNMENVNYYCNFTFVITSISESNVKPYLNVSLLKENANSLANTQQAVFDYLLNSVYSSNSESSKQRQEIEHTLFVDEVTGISNISKFLFDFSLKKFNKACMITMKNENTLKAFLSESKFNIYFNQYYKAIISALNNDSFNCYIYKKTALIVTAGSEISDTEFVERMEILQQALANFKFSSYVLVGEFALVINEDEIIRKAELTLERMRNKNIRFLVYTPQMGLEQHNAEKMKMLAIINDAVANDRIIPFFQGIHDNFQKNIYLYEALMRIEDENGTVYTPYHFMEIAKEYGFYHDISHAMITKVLSIFRDKKESVTINMTISDIYNYDTVHTIFTFLASAPEPSHFIFELTETEEINDYQIVYEFADKIHALGAKIAIDDFGSGFSNLVSIFKINADIIKIDGEIIKNIVNDTVVTEFLELIAMWSEKHNKQVVAEYVENQDIQTVIEQNKIKYSQGYLFSKPEKMFQ